MRLFAILSLLVSAAVAQQEPATTPCDFDDNMQMSVQYSPAGHDEPKNGKIWTPGGAAFTLYTQTPIVINNVTIPVGAFSLAVIPGKKDWTLVVNKNVTAGAKYDQTQDIVRAPMETGEIGQAVTDAQVTLAHMGPKTCSFRIYFGKIGAFTEFKEK
jgi:Protein of unknown function (DUF2911)